MVKFLIPNRSMVPVLEGLCYCSPPVEAKVGTNSERNGIKDKWADIRHVSPMVRWPLGTNCHNHILLTWIQTSAPSAAALFGRSLKVLKVLKQRNEFVCALCHFPRTFRDMSKTVNCSKVLTRPRSKGKQKYFIGLQKLFC